MKASLVLSAVAALVAFAPLASARESKAWGRSPSKYITWSVDPADNSLYFTSQEGSSAKLCDVSAPRALKLTFSPDEKYVIVTDGSSIGTRVSLYKRSSGVKYSKVTAYDFDLATQRLAMEVKTGTNISSPVLKNSRYLDCVGWSKDGQWAFLSLSGEGTLNGRKVEIDRFACIFNPSSGEFASR